MVDNFINDVVNQTNAIVDASPTLSTGQSPALTNLEADVSYLITNLGGGSTAIARLNSSIASRSWTTWANTSFSNFYNNFLDDDNISGSYNDLLSAFVTSYKAQLLGDTGDLTALNGVSPDFTAQFLAAWQSFTSTFPPNGAGFMPSALSFFTEWRKFTAKTATLLESTSNNVIVNNVDGTTTAPRTLPSYETAFNTYFPNLKDKIDTATGKTFFQEALEQFYTQAVSVYGYFIPSHLFGNWVNNLQLISKTVPSVTSTILSTTPQNDSRILNEIFSLLVGMIGALQNVAAAQSNRLALYTSWQKGYNSILSQIHVFTASSQDLLSDNNFGLPGSTLAKRRNDVQGTFNASLTQTVTSYKDVVTDDAKALQSNINRSSDAFNEQANTATAILQQISTILSAIFR